MPELTRPLYCSEAMVRSELPIDLPSGSFDSADLTQRIAMWSGFIDDYLAGQYDVPFSAFPFTPSTITIACILLVVHYSYILAGVPTEKEDPRQSLWGRALDLLDKVRDRTIILTDNDGDPSTNPARSTLPLMIGPSQSPASLMSQRFLLGPTMGQYATYSGSYQGGYAVWAGDDVPEGK
jgi:hypothetical protein